MRKALAILAGLLVILGVVGGLLRVRALEAAELDSLSEPVTPAVLVTRPERDALGEVVLDEGQGVVFEVCARGPFAPEAFEGRVAFEVWSREGPHLLRRTEVDAAQLARARPVGAFSCMEIARTDHLPTDGAHVVTLDWGGGAPPAPLAAVPLAIHVQAVGTPVRLDHLVYLATLLGAALALLALALRTPLPAPTDPAAPLALAGPPPPHPWARVAVAVGALLGAELLLALLPFGGRTYALTRGLLLAAVQLVAALSLVRPVPPADLRHALALARPPRPLLWLALALGTGVLLPPLAFTLQRLIPATSESHVASLVAFPSGLLAVRIVGALAPVVEEVFFRGFVYGAIDDAIGPTSAFLVAVVAFALVHVPQVAGDLGSLAAILAAGVLLTALRRGSGSALVPALAHLVYNALL